MSILPTWPIAAGALVIGLALGAAGAVAFKNNQIERIEAKHGKEIAGWKEAQAVALAKYNAADLAHRTREAAIRETADKSLQVKEDEKNRIAARLDSALNSLQNRPARPAASAGKVPATATACKGATGADLYRDDAALALREAARADKLRAALAQCYAQYDAARDQLNQPLK